MLPRDTLLLDLGSYEIKGIFLDSRSDQFIYEREKKTGFYNGYVKNVFDFQSAVLSLIKKVEVKTEKKISSVALLLSGKILEYKTLSVQNLKINGVIDQFKLDLFASRVEDWVKAQKGVLLKFFPVEYLLDDCKIENPYGLSAENLSFKYFVCYVLDLKIKNLIYVLEQLNLDVVDLIPSIFALGDRYLSDDEKKLGSLIFDIGSSKLHWSFYYKGVPVKAGNINIGSEIMTAKIARGLKISLDEASKIKHEFLAALLKPEHFCSWISIKRDSGDEFILQSEMVRKILPEVEVFIAEIKKILDAFIKQNAYYVVFCGNGSYLSDLIPTVQKSYNSISLKLIKYDDVFGLSEILFEHLKSETTLKKFQNFIKKFLGYFWD